MSGKPPQALGVEPSFCGFVQLARGRVSSRQVLEIETRELFERQESKGFRRLQDRASDSRVGSSEVSWIQIQRLCTQGLVDPKTCGAIVGFIDKSLAYEHAHNHRGET